MAFDCDQGLRSLGSGFAPAFSDVLSIGGCVAHVQQAKTRCLEQAFIFAGRISSAEWTAPQQEYAAKFNGNGVYTPQMIVDGHRQFAGTREFEAEQAIQESANRAKMDVAVTAQEPASDGVQHFKVRVGKLVGSTDMDTAEDPSPGG